MSNPKKGCSTTRPIYITEVLSACIAENMTYSEDQITKFVELAHEVGIGRTIRELGYPKSWNTGRYWCENRGVSVAVDEVTARAAASRDWWTDKQVIVGAEAGMELVHERISMGKDLTPDDVKKLSEAYMKFYNTWATAQGKAANISENRQNDITIAPHLKAMLDIDWETEFADNKEEKPKESTLVL